MVPWDFSKLLGVYLALFAFFSVVWGRVAFEEQVPLSPWLSDSVWIPVKEVNERFSHYPMPREQLASLRGSVVLISCT